MAHLLHFPFDCVSSEELVNFVLFAIDFNLFKIRCVESFRMVYFLKVNKIGIFRTDYIFFIN